MLMNFIDANLYQAQGKSINNFDRLLPDAQSDLARETLKDPYNFDFLTLAENYKEKELEDALNSLHFNRMEFHTVRRYTHLLR